MEKLLDKMKEYLHMDTELPYEEFSEYYQGFMAYLAENYDKLEQQDLIKARFIASIVQSNADDRAKRKSTVSKKFKKIADKSGVWVEAIALRLTKGGMSPVDIDKATQEISDTMD